MEAKIGEIELSERNKNKVKVKKWRQVGESLVTKVVATISGSISASACLLVESPKIAFSSVKITSNVFTIPKSSNEETGFTRRNNAN